MIESLNTQYPVRSLAERDTTNVYFMSKDPSEAREMSILSKCHEHTGIWQPESDSREADLQRVRHSIRYKPLFHWDGSDCVRVGWPKWGRGARESVRDTEGFSKCLTGEVCLSCSWQYEQHLERVADASALAAKLNRK